MELQISRRNSRVGLTLLELVVALGILAVLATLVFPRYSSKRASLESVSKEALSLFQLAQQQANATFSERSVSFNRNLLHVSEFEMEDLNREVLSVTRPDSDFSIVLSQSLDALIFSPTQDVMGFLGVNKVSLSTPVNIVFTSSDSHTRNITIYPKSRRVQFK